MPMNSYKGYYGILKGIVTRTDDPKLLENNNHKRIQVYIPSYHPSPYVNENDNTLDTKKIGSGSDEGIYPWAQVCGNVFNGSSNNDASQSGNVSFWGAALSVLSSQMSSITNISPNEGVYPSVGDVVWLMFEGGDIRCPVCIGSLSSLINIVDIPKDNNVLYTNTGRSLASVCVDLIKEILGLEYGTISNID